MAIVAHKLFLYCVVLFWMLVAIYFFKSYNFNDSEVADELKISLRVMEELQRQNMYLKEIAADIRSLDQTKNDGDKEFLQSLKRELSLCQAKKSELSQNIESQQSMQVKSSIGQSDNGGSTYSRIIDLQNQVQEISYFIHAKLKSFKVKGKLPNEDVEDMANDVKSRISAALIDVERIKESERSRQAQEMKILEEMVQSKIQQIQNPKDCASAKRVVCGTTKSCGFGCQLHHVTYCLLIAIATERTLILESGGWRYAPGGWESVFLNLSDTCHLHPSGKNPWKGHGENEEDLVIDVPIIDTLRNKPPYLPLSIPSQLAPKLTLYHGNPPVWWMGQLVKYATRPQSWLLETMENFEKAIGYQHPIVGIHIRRTDKVGTEAAFHPIDEYMAFVIDWYDREDMKRQRSGNPQMATRLVYIASDDPNALSEAVQRYPEYKFIGNASISQNAAVRTRYSKDGLIGVFTDITLLSKCDFFVGTFSSQVSRAAYEMMQTLHPDAASYAHSLDDIYYFGGQHAHSQKALYSHKAKPGSEEFNFNVGDTIGIAGNHWDGYSKGINRRTQEKGLYPSYKVREVINAVKFSQFPEP